MADSVLDKLTPVITEISRKMNDVNLNILGTKAKVLRIVYGEKDVFGESTENLEPACDIIANVIIKHPLGSQVQLFESLSDQTLETDSLDLWEILPFEMRILSEGTYGTEPVAIKKGDLIIEVLEDFRSNKVPLILKVTKVFGGFFGKNMNSRKFELTLYRGTLPSFILKAIENYVNNLE